MELTDSTSRNVQTEFLLEQMLSDQLSKWAKAISGKTDNSAIIAGLIICVSNVEKSLILLTNVPRNKGQSYTP
jgi:hypothetical protein